MTKNKKEFAIYKNNMYKHPKGDIWTLHSRYETMDQALQALRDISKEPKKLRANRYIIFPTLDPNKRAILIKEEYREGLIKKSR